MKQYRAFTTSELTDAISWLNEKIKLGYALEKMETVSGSGRFFSISYFVLVSKGGDDE